MNSNGLDDNGSDGLPQAEVRRKRRIGLVWLIPIIAALVAASLAVKAIISRGPTINIIFTSAEGLEAGKTRIRYKDVEVGRVTAVDLSEDLSHVIVTADMVPGMASYLTTSAHFWIVRARVSARQITGLTTLFSGVYIAMEPGKQGPPIRHFKGLEQPPVVTMGMPGSYFTLKSKSLDWLDIGLPVYYRQIDVGQIVSYGISPDGSSVELRIFVEAPYDKFVRENTRFWNASGISASLGANGVDIKVESFVTLLIGGVAFGTPPDVEAGPPAREDEMFTLYPSYSAITETEADHLIYFLTYFDQSVRGLSAGAPVEFRGIKIGEVASVQLDFNLRQLSAQIPVLLYIDPERFNIIGKAATPESRKVLFEKLIAKGLRTQLKSGMLLTGQLYVGLDFFPDAPPATLKYQDKHPVLPSVPSPMADITASVAQLLRRLESLPIEQVGTDLQASLARLRSLLSSNNLPEALAELNQGLAQFQKFAAGLNTDIGPHLLQVIQQTRSTLAEAQQTLKSADRIVGANSPLTNEMQQTLEQLSSAARAVRDLADYLQRHPNSLIFGR